MLEIAFLWTQMQHVQNGTKFYDRELYILKISKHYRDAKLNAPMIKIYYHYVNLFASTVMPWYVFEVLKFWGS